MVRGLVFLAGLAAISFPLSAQDRHPDTILRAAFLAEARGNNREAVALFREYFARGPESAFARRAFARVLSLEGEHGAAEEEILKALKVGPESAEQLVAYAEVMRRAGKPAQALERLIPAASRIDGSSAVEFQIAEIYFEQKDYRRAQVHYRQVIFHAETAGALAGAYRERALWRLANLHLQLGDEERSRFYFVQFVRRNPDNLYARFVLGYFLYFRKGDFDRAHRELEAVAQFSESRLREAGVNLPQLYSALGGIHIVHEDYRALHYVKKAIRAGSTDVLDKILLLVLEGKDRDALRYLGAYLRGDPSNFVARVARLRILQKMDVPDLLTMEYLTTSLIAGKIERHRTGIELAERGLAANAKRTQGREGPASHLLQQIAAHYEALNQNHRAVLYLRESIELGNKGGRWEEPGPRRELELAMARLLSRVDRHEDALELCNRLIAEVPTLAPAYFVLGNVHRRTKQLEKAEDAFTKAAELEPKNFVYLFLRATVRHDRKDFDGTEADLRKVLEIKPDFAEASNFLGYMYAERGVRLQESLRLIGQAVEVAPVNGAFQDSLGWVYYRLGDYSRARYHLQLAVLLLEEEEQEDALVYEHLGDVHMQLKSPGRAMQAFRRGQVVLEQRAAGGQSLTEEDRQVQIRLRQKIEKLTSKDGR